MSANGTDIFGTIIVAGEIMPYQRVTDLWTGGGQTRRKWRRHARKIAATPYGKRLNQALTARISYVPRMPFRLGPLRRRC